MNQLKRYIKCHWLLRFCIVKMDNFHQILKGVCKLKKDKDSDTRELAGKGEVLLWEFNKQVLNEFIAHHGSSR